MKSNRIKTIVEETIRKHLMLKENLNPTIAIELEKHIVDLQNLIQMVETKEHVSKRDVDVLNIEKAIEYLLMVHKHIVRTIKK